MANRTCARCGKDLTDAASMEVGTGPICRKMDNALLAATIPANVEAAIKAWGNVANLPSECQLTSDRVWADLNEGSSIDWRATVKRLEWLASWGNVVQVTEITSVIRALGYVGLANMIGGDAASGKASIRAHEGRLYIQGPNNKAGRMAIKAIQGRRFHPADSSKGTRAEWSVPSNQGEAFKLVVISHWPNHEGLTESLDVIASLPVSTTAEVSAPKAPSARMETVSGGFMVYTPYNPDFVSAIKAIAYRNRKWVPASKAWFVTPDMSFHVRSLVLKHYGISL